jgi:hypothetical protein
MGSKIWKVVGCLSVLSGGSMVVATDYSQSGITNMEEARNFKVLSRRCSISDEQIGAMISNTVRFFNQRGRLDRAVAVMWKLDSVDLLQK